MEEPSQLKSVSLISPEQYAKTISYYSYPGSKTKGFLTEMSPKEYLSLTTRDEEHQKKIGEQSSKLGNFDIKKFQSEHLPYLDVNEKGKVVDHEGRHRAYLMQRAGINKFPVVISVPNAQTTLPTRVLQSQFNPNSHAISVALPLGPTSQIIQGMMQPINKLKQETIR
jgi:hypothetical protein